MQNFEKKTIKKIQAPMNGGGGFFWTKKRSTQEWGGFFWTIFFEILIDSTGVKTKPR